MVRVFVITCVLVLVAAACGDSDSATTSTSGAGATTTAAPTTTTAAPTTTTVAPTTAAPTTTSAAPTTTTATLIGEPYDFWVPVPDEGPIVGVVGVQYDDTLNLRTGPNISFDVITTLEPTRTGIAGTGRGWQLPSGSVWWEIDVDGVVGWANQRFLSRLGDVTDLTSFVVDRLGETPVAETMLDLGLAVAAAFVDIDVESKVVVTVAPTAGDLGEVTYDVVGVGDDSVGGHRLHIFGQPTESGDGFSLMSVEANIFCQRGVNAGICA